MSIDTATLSEFNEKDVLLYMNADPETAIEGHCAGASAVGIAFKPKGKRDIQLIEPSDVASITLAPKKPSKITQKKQLPVPVDRVRSHLANSHGIGLAWLNQATNEQAAEFHDGLDHTDLSHNHLKVEGETDETPDPEQTEESGE